MRLKLTFLRPVTRAASTLLGVCLCGLPPTAARAQTATVEGLVVDASLRQPVAEAVVMLARTGFTALTREDGNFRITGVPPGNYQIRVSHLAYGEHLEPLTVAAGDTVRLRIAVSPTAITLEPIGVEAFSRLARAARGSGSRLNVVSLEEIQQHIGTNMTLADVLQRHVPGIRVRQRDGLVGRPVCIEFRASQGTSCRSPAVFLDGVRVSVPTILYGQIDLRTIESMEVVPAAEAGVRFGPGALNGALLIESRRPGLRDTGDAPVRYVERGGFDWSLEAAPHRGGRVYATSLAAASAGLALGLTAASQCIGLRSPNRDSIVTTCDGWTTLGAAAAAVALPALGGGLAARIAGGTERSQGRLLPAAVGATMVLIPGYAAILSGQRSDSDFLEWTGRAMVVLGVPLAVTVSDRLFRKLR